MESGFAMSQGKRTERISNLIKHELAEAVTKNLCDPRIGFVTITEVRMSDDLKYARVFYSVIGNSEQCMETQKGLEEARGYLQHHLAQALKLRFTPLLSFAYDPTLEEGGKIDTIIDQIHTKDASESRA